MRNTFKFAKIAAIVLAIAGTSYAAGPITKFSTDELWIGKSGSTADHKYKWDFGLGNLNPALSVDSLTKTMFYNKNSIKFGDGNSSVKSLTADIGAGSSNPVIAYDPTLSSWAFANDGTNFSAFGSGSGSGTGINLLSNPGFESGVAQDWTNSGGTFVSVNSGANLLIGLKSATFTASASGQYVQSGLHTVQNGMAGSYCSAGMLYKGGDSNLTFEVRDNSSNLLASKVIDASTGPSTFSLPFVCPSSGSVRVKLISSAAAALIAMDQVFLGQSATSQISQASFFGGTKLTGSSSCNFGTSGTGAWTTFGTNGTCDAPTNYGNAVSSTKSTQVDFNSLPPGDYLVIFSGYFTSDASSVARWRITDGTTSDGYQENAAVGASQIGQSGQIIGRFTYTTAQSAKSFKLEYFIQSGSGTVYADNSGASGRELQMRVYHFPTQSQIASTPDTSGLSWSGYHDSDCVWSTTSSTYVTPSADASCTFVEKTNRNFGTVSSTGSKTPGITFTPPKTGMYYVCADAHGEGTVDAALATRLWDGTNSLAETTFWNEGAFNRLGILHTCGVFNATSVSTASIFVQMQTNAGTFSVTGSNIVLFPAIQWSIFALDQSFPAPVMAGTVTSGASGVERIERVLVTAQCTSDPCTIASQSGSWVTAINRTGAGQYAVHISAGTFSSAPTCTMIGQQSVVYPSLNGAPTTSLVNLYFDGVTDPSAGFGMICMGPH